MDLERRIYIVGPTCSGKTELAIELVERFGGEVISCDSIQIYQGLEIGAAKPTAEQLARAPHHLINIVPVGQSLTAGDFRKRAIGVIDERHALGVKNFWLVGGSGFYISSLQNGMFELKKIDPAIREHFRDRLEREGLAVLYQDLIKIDPIYAAKVGASDTYRILRGLEIFRQHNRPLSEIRSEFFARESAKRIQGQVFKFGLRRDRTELRQLVIARTKRMLDSGLVDETRALLAQGLGAWPPLSSVGYKEARAYLAGQLTSDQLGEQIVTSTMQLAKRQMTWFNRDREIRWYEPQQKAQLIAAVERFLNGGSVG